MAYRLMYRFWLDMEKPEQEAIADQIEHLKNHRLFSRAVRDGIRLFYDLSQGRVGVLLELFPGVRDYFYDQFRAEQGSAAQSESVPGPLQPDSGPRLIAAPQFDAPTYDDDDGLLLEVRADANAGQQATQNFLHSLFALQG